MVVERAPSGTDRPAALLVVQPDVGPGAHGPWTDATPVLEVVRGCLRPDDSVVALDAGRLMVVTRSSLYEADAVARMVGERIRGAVHALPAVDGRGATVSVGATVMAPDESLDSALPRAAAALRRARDEGGDRMRAVWPEPEVFFDELGDPLDEL